MRLTTTRVQPLEKEPPKPLAVIHCKRLLAVCIVNRMLGTWQWDDLPTKGNALFIDHAAGGITKVYKTKLKDSDKGALLWAVETWAFNQD